jgi:hypothetical protein
MGDNWRSAGYDQFNRKVDAEWHAYFMFITVSLGLVVVSFIFAYTPDRAMSDWAIREVGRRRSLRSLCVFVLCHYSQCCGSGIQCLFNPWIRDGEKIRFRDEQPGSYFLVRRNQFLLV